MKNISKQSVGKWGLKTLVGGMAILAFLGAASSPSEAMSPKKPEASSEARSSQQESVWVSKSDGELSCEPGSGKSLAQGAEELKKAGIPVLDSQKGSDSDMHIQMCGAEKGTLNSFLIPKNHLSAAIGLGYQLASNSVSNTAASGSSRVKEKR